MTTNKPAAQRQRCKQASTDNAPSNETHRTAAPPTGEPVQISSVPTTTEVGSEPTTTGTDPSTTTAAAPILVESAGQTSECAGTSLAPQDRQLGEPVDVGAIAKSVHESTAEKDQGSATDQNDECHESSIVPVPIAPPMAEAPEPTILPPATELAATEPVLPPTQVDYSALDTKALDAAIVKSLEIASHYARQFDAEKKAHLLPALMEMETRWNKKQGARSDLSQLPIQGKWHDYLRHCGVKPSTYRGWKKGYYDAIALMSPQLGGESASLPSSDVLTSVQKEVVSALVDQGYRQSDALALVKTVTGDTFAELFTNCLANRLKAADRQKQSAPAGDAQTEPVPVTAEPVDSQSKAGATPEAVKLGAESPRYEESQQPVSDDVTVQPPQPPAILPVAREAKADSVTPEEFETVLGAVPVLEVQALKDETSARIKEIKPWIEEQLARLQHDAKADANACKTKYIGDAIDTFVSRLASGFNGPSFQKTLTARDKRTYPDDLRHVAETLRRGGWMLLSMARNMAQVSAEEQPEEHAPANDTEPDSDAQEQSPCPESVTTQSSTEKAVETSAEAETQEPPVQSVPKKKPVKASTAKPIKADGVTAKPGYLCKFQGTDWEILAVSDGDDPHGYFDSHGRR